VRRGTLAFAAAILLLLGTGYIYLTGWVVVVDPAGVLDRVALSNRDAQRPLARLPRGIHAGLVSLEGQTLLICRNGSVTSLGYVTGMDHVWHEAKPVDCRGGTRQEPRFIDAPG
jgi:hypothetical protein